MALQRKPEHQPHINPVLSSAYPHFPQDTDLESDYPQKPETLSQDPEALFTETQASILSGLSIRWYQKMRQQGGGPKFVKISSRCVRYRRKDLIAYFEERLATSTSDIF